MKDLFSARLSCELQQLVASFLSVGEASVFMRSTRSNHDLIRYSTSLWKQWCLQRWSGHWKGQLSTFITEESDKDDKDETVPSSSSPDFYNILKHASEFNPPSSMDTSKCYPSLLASDRDYFDRIGPTTFRLCDERQIPYSYITIRAETPLPRFRMPGTPFVWPFRKEGNAISLRPAHVSYFELKILPRQEQQQQRGISSQAVAVVIGLSFSANLPTECTCTCGTCGYLPGWDHLSMGYHGDDGGLYYASSSRARRRYGPTFGEGDTVGCGVDYQRQCFFFTRNRSFLGQILDKDIVGRLRKSNADDSPRPLQLFPVVGVDSSRPTIEVNFGEREFVFDLFAYM